MKDINGGIHMETKHIFNTENGYVLTIITNKTNIQLEVEDSQGNELPDYKNHKLAFNTETFKEIFHVLEEDANKVWKALVLKEVNSFGNDYYEYYDRELDNNGYLAIRNNQLTISRVFEGSKRVYQFNKQKMATFLYDFKDLVDESV